MSQSSVFYLVKNLGMYLVVDYETTIVTRLKNGKNDISVETGTKIIANPEHRNANVMWEWGIEDLEDWYETNGPGWIAKGGWGSNPYPRKK